MKHKKIAALLSVLLLSACGAKDTDDQQTTDGYIAVYVEITYSLDENLPTLSDDKEDSAENNVTEAVYSLMTEEYDYLNNVLFIGNSQVNALTEYGLIPEENVIAVENIRASELHEGEIDGNSIKELIVSKSKPYIYLWFEADVFGEEKSPEAYGYEVVELAEWIRELCPESMVLILGNAAVSSEYEMSELISEYNDTLHVCVRSCPDEYVIYFDVRPAAADHSENLLSDFGTEDGKRLSSQGMYKTLEYICRDRFYNDMTEDMSSEALYGELYAHRSEYTVTEGKVAYLTFDDGPSKYTPQILEILRENDIKATFFITGWCIDGKEHILRQTADEGHTIAMHSYSHDYYDIYASVDDWLSDLLRVNNRIYAVTGQKPWAFRFPGGSYNNYNRDTADDIIAEMNARGYVYYDWNAATADASTEATYESCMEYLENSVNSDHEVVLMHDSLELTPEYLQDVIDFLREKGYSFETVDTADPVVF